MQNSERAKRAEYALATLVEDVGVNHGGADVPVAEQLLHGADFITGL